MSEILGALFKYLVALLGASAVVAVFYLTLGQSKVQEAISQLVQLQTNIQQLYNGQPSFEGLSAEIAINAGIAPSQMVNGKNLFNPWGAAVTVEPSDSDANFTITSNGVPKDACTKFVMGLGAAGSSITATKVTTDKDYDLTIPFTVSNLATACTGTAVVAVTYRR